ncbi:MAG TPA: DUF1573 domain-containing protein [Thermoanaerobaculia bacterium]|nr:DUF1573 domain-containing protein [Thermoanaerobaculia bacterium]
MSDDFGTVNLKVIRQQYRRHRESLAQMIADAPTEHLANEYRRLIRDIDVSIGKLDELDGAATPPPAEAAGAPQTPGMRPLVSTYEAEELPRAEAEPRSRLPIIIVIALVALAAIGWLIWRASSDRAPEGGTVVEDTVATTSTAPETSATIVPATPAASLAVKPASHDYGVIRKGTRATRQFEVSNTSDEPITMVVARSTCRCLFYEYRALIPPKGKETVTVTVDGARAKAGALHETIRVTSKSDATVGATFDVSATVQ